MLKAHFRRFLSVSPDRLHSRARKVVGLTGQRRAALGL
jgi:hypothetical protein